MPPKKQAKPKEAASSGAFRNWRAWLGNSVFVIALVLVTLLAYQPAWHAGFIWDDDDYITNNSLLTAPDGLHRIWFTLDSPSQYFPLTYTVFRFERLFWGLNPTGYHLVNIFGHAVNALIFWVLLRRLAIPGAWLGAAIFALHPVHVESVAWITELKNILSLCLALLSLLAWTISTWPGSSAKFTRGWYVGSIFLFTLALLAKTTVTPLPVLLLLLLWFKEVPINRNQLLRLVPFFVVALAMGLLSIWWERFHQGTQGLQFALSGEKRLLVASHAIWFYFGKLVFPVNLSFSYPKWPLHVAEFVWLGLCLLVLVCIAFIPHRFSRIVKTTVGWYVLSLAPLLGFIMLYTFRYTYVADHYQYLASLGPIALLATLIVRLRTVSKLLPPLIAALLLATLAGLTWRQSGTYVNSETLWTATLARNPTSWLAHNNLGLYYLNQNDWTRAEIHFRRGLEINSEQSEGHNNLGNVLAKKNLPEAAIKEFRTAFQLQPGFADAHYNLAKVWDSKGRNSDAEQEYLTALRLNPRHVLSSYNLANLYLRIGLLEQAIQQFQATLALIPGNAGAHNNLASALMRVGRAAEAEQHYHLALASDPSNSETLINLGNALILENRAQEAIPYLQQAISLESPNPAAHISLGIAWLVQGQPRNAIPELELGSELNPVSAPGAYNLGLARLAIGETNKAVEAFRETIRRDARHPGAIKQLELLNLSE